MHNYYKSVRKTPYQNLLERLQTLRPKYVDLGVPLHPTPTQPNPHPMAFDQLASTSTDNTCNKVLSSINEPSATQHMSKELKYGIEILVSQAILKLWIKTVKILFWSVTQELLGLLKFKCYFWVL